MTKYYMLHEDVGNILSHNRKFLFYPWDNNSYWLINLSELEMNTLNLYSNKELTDYKIWKCFRFINLETYEFLIKKYSYLLIKNFAINCFDLSNEDIMYMKLMDWIQ